MSFFSGLKIEPWRKNPILLFTTTLNSTPKLEKYFFSKRKITTFLNLHIKQTQIFHR